MEFSASSSADSSDEDEAPFVPETADPTGERSPKRGRFLSMLDNLAPQGRPQEPVNYGGYQRWPFVQGPGTGRTWDDEKETKTTTTNPFMLPLDHPPNSADISLNRLHDRLMRAQANYGSATRYHQHVDTYGSHLQQIAAINTYQRSLAAYRAAGGTL